MSCCCFGTITTGELGVVESRGRYNRIAEAGCFCVNPLACEYLAGRVSLRVQQLNCVLETKTGDNVFVAVNVAIQYQVLKEKIYESFYVLENPEIQMRAHVFDTVRQFICTMTLDQAFASKEEISVNLKEHMAEVMAGFGFMILQALVTELTPDIVVRNAMNEINAAKRQKEAAYQKAEGEKIIKVKAAEANAESMYLSGMGVAKQRKAIMTGLKESIVEFNSMASDTTAKDVMDLLVLNQYFDTIQELGNNKHIKFVFTDVPNVTRGSLLEAGAAC